MQGQKNEANIVLKHFRGIRYGTEAELTRLEFQTSEMREIEPNISDLKNYQRATCIILGKRFSLISN